LVAKEMSEPIPIIAMTAAVRVSQVERSDRNFTHSERRTRIGVTGRTATAPRAPDAVVAVGLSARAA
jgi:hypothetical protein